MLNYTQEQLLKRSYGVNDKIQNIDDNCYIWLVFDKELHSFVVAHYDGWRNDFLFNHKISSDEAELILNKHKVC